MIGKAGPIIPAVAASAERIERVHSDDKCDSHASDRPEFGRIEQRVQPQFADVRLGVVKSCAATTHHGANIQTVHVARIYNAKAKAVCEALTCCSKNYRRCTR